jgi:prolyl 4-hydroxylase
VSRDEDPDGVLAWVEEKTAQITGIPSGHGEVRCPADVTCMRLHADGGFMQRMLTSCWLRMQPFNVLRYENGQHYDAHYDVFDPESYGPQTSQRVRQLMTCTGAAQLLFSVLRRTAGGLMLAFHCNSTRA